MFTLRTTRSRLVIGALTIGVAACSTDVGTAPTRLTPAAPDRALGPTSSVFDVQLRAFPNDPALPPNPVYGFGNLQIRLGSLVDNSCLPPNPVTPQPGMTLVSVCGKIFNAGGALYQGGGIYTAPSLFSDGVIVADFNGTRPANACRRYDVAGAVLVADALAAAMIANPTGYQVRFDGSILGSSTRLGGLLDGSAWGPIGDRPETDPYFAAKVCTVAIAP